MTEILNMNNNSYNIDKIKFAANIINNGGLVAFPTETVYGLGANGLNEEAVSKIFKAKGRPSDNPIILHISNEEMLGDLVKDIPCSAQKLIKKYWPGPLTLIFKKSDIVPEIITAGMDTVAIRMPSNEIAQSLIKEANVPIAAPSANISGRPSTTRTQHVIEDLYGKVDVIIASDNCEIGLESTVLDISGKCPVLLRPGRITLEELKSIIGQVEVDQGIIEQCDVIKVKSPGMKYKHYAPRAELKIVKGEIDSVINKINDMSRTYNKMGKTVGILATDQSKDKYSANKVLSIGDRFNPNEIMAKLFDSLRQLDKYNVDIIISEGFSNEGIELAITNRLNKAAGYDIINV
ncbi:MAG: L-threonylcarbamoyladenylate synthase [Eubacteriaceae bacterium]